MRKRIGKGTGNVAEPAGLYERRSLACRKNDFHFYNAFLLRLGRAQTLAPFGIITG